MDLSRPAAGPEVLVFLEQTPDLASYAHVDYPPAGTPVLPKGMGKGPGAGRGSGFSAVPIVRVWKLSRTLQAVPGC